METLAYATIAQLKQLLADHKISPEEVYLFFKRRFELYDATLQSALEIFDKDFVLGTSAKDGVLAGIPGLIKDNIAIRGRSLTCASRILSGFTAPYDATSITQLKKAGALLMGRANMDEFAMGSSTETSAYAKTKNPWDTRRVPGGSSGGSAAAVAAGLVPWALGSETGGSVRQPAAFCGIVGIKPTYGRVSRYGLVAYGSSLDQIGVFSRTVQDNAQILSVIAGHDQKDGTSLTNGAEDFSRLLNGSLPEKLTIGVVENSLQAEGIDTDVYNALNRAILYLEARGATIKKVLLPTLDYGAAAYFIISRAEAASNLARFDGVRYEHRVRGQQTLGDMYTKTRQEGFGKEVKLRILTGNYVLSAGHAAAFYENAQIARRLIQEEFYRTFKKVDLLFMPTHPAPAFQLGAFDKNKLQMDLQDYFTCPVNLAGIPAISIPCGFSTDGMPIGMQLIGPHESEALLYQVAYVYEQANGWHEQRPPAFV